MKKPPGILAWIVALFVGYVIFSAFGGRDSVSTPAQAGPATTSAQKPPEKSVAEHRRERLEAMDQKTLAESMRGEFEALCKLQDSHLNYIKAQIRGSNLYCVHDFYNQYSLSSGIRAKGIEAFININHEWLKKAKIKKIGVWGTGEYASGSWFDLT